MAVPDFQTLMLPVLRLAEDGQEHALAEAREVLAKTFSLNERELQEMLPSGRQTKFANRVAWAKTYLQQAGLITSSRRAHFQITARGRDVMRDPPDRINIEFLENYPEFLTFRARRESQEPVADVVQPAGEPETPEEALETAYLRMREGLGVELLNRVKTGSPQFFERLVVSLLINMGYGGSRKDAGEAIGQAGDEGIDGVINEDRLGLDTVYIQAKKWESTVGRPEIQKFVGALHGKRARKGVFITTGVFSAEARDYVSHIDPKVVLIDGRQLVEFMIDFEVGVSTSATYHLKKIDSDYFDE